MEVDLLVVGALASDTIWDYTPLAGASESPVLKTSNLSRMSQSAGGVGRNVATAAHFAGARVALASVVADDIAGNSLLDQLTTTGLPSEYIRKLSTSDGASTAQYVAVNDAKKELVMAMADMSIFTRPELEIPESWKACFETSRPKWVVVDGNWSPQVLSSIFDTARSLNIPTAFEPVSTAKSIRLFDKASPSIALTSSTLLNEVSLAAPNALELAAMYLAAREGGYFESEGWWQAIDSFGLSDSGSRDKFAQITSHSLVEQGTPQQALQLLPYIPNLVIKLGPQGCLLVQLLKPGDPKLTNLESSPFILARNLNDHPKTGGIYMRLFPAFASVPDKEILSVNGIGDSMLGVVMASLVKGKTLDEAVPIGQEAAVLSLKSSQAVSSEIQQLKAKVG